MGNSSSMLTQYDIEEVQEHCSNTFSQQEIVSLYQRFCQLDRNGCGFISAEEFMTVPEFAVNPLSQIVIEMLDGLNFKEFVAFLSAFSSRASLQQKVEFIFKVYDSDGNGKVTFNEMLDILRDLTGQFISEQQREKVLAQVLEEAGYAKDSLLVQADFMKDNLFPLLSLVVAFEFPTLVFVHQLHDSHKYLAKTQMESSMDSPRESPRDSPGHDT
ncbi:calcineurin subunit b [Phtheirospermum japonicum]|uniref:Calcineurin subunit b n=1 Tax=Phtheirospermum japonicum TaxID=374723 RepID=A0A830CI33_9LAMI|nr:calcineurin subunit b [Phtheirospermum japonicum]